MSPAKKTAGKKTAAKRSGAKRGGKSKAQWAKLARETEHYANPEHVGDVGAVGEVGDVGSTHAAIMAQRSD